MTRILVITPYTKRIGIAFFDGRELVYFAVKTFRRPRTMGSIRGETRLRVVYLIRRFKPAILIVKSVSSYQHASQNHREISRSIRVTARRAKVATRSISFESAKRQIVLSGRMTKKRTFRILGQRYPAIARYVPIRNRDEDEYYTPLLSAVAVGSCYARRRVTTDG